MTYRIRAIALLACILSPLTLPTSSIDRPINSAGSAVALCAESVLPPVIIQPMGDLSSEDGKRLEGPHAPGGTRGQNGQQLILA